MIKYSWHERAALRLGILCLGVSFVAMALLVTMEGEPSDYPWHWRGLAFAVSVAILATGFIWMRAWLVRQENERTTVMAGLAAHTEGERAQATAIWEREREQAAERYQAAVLHAESVARRATALLPPAADPDEVAARLRDLAVDVSTKIEADGAVVVTLRRR